MFFSSGNTMGLFPSPSSSEHAVNVAIIIMANAMIRLILFSSVIFIIV